MQPTRFFVVFVVLIGRICLSKIVIKTDKSDGTADLENAAIKILSNCYAHFDTTIVLAGNIPGRFIRKLSFQRFSIVLLNEQRQTEISVEYWEGNNAYKVHKVHILVTMAPYYKKFQLALETFTESRYRGTTPFVLMLGWTPENKYAGCKGTATTRTILITAQMYKLPHANLICRNIKRGIVIYSSSVFRHDEAKPWRLYYSHYNLNVEHRVSYFIRDYREYEGMCENLFIEKMHDMDGLAISTRRRCKGKNCSGKLVKSQAKDKLLRLEAEDHFAFIRDFLVYMNATENPIWENIVVGQNQEADCCTIGTTPIHMRGAAWNASYAYPFGKECKFIVTQFRGHKTQLQKVYDVIDIYSWFGMYTVYLISLLFFKFFMQQPLLEGILNLCRLTCSLGIIKLPMDVASRIYFGCLLFFMLTMEGIFTSSMASVMTLDVPVRQVYSIQDLADLGYTVYADETDLVHFIDQKFKDRLILKLFNEDCIRYVIRDASTACLTWGAGDRLYAAEYELHVSNCVKTEYLVNAIPRNWALQEHFDNFVGIKKGGGIMTDLDVLVEEKRLLEAELEEKIIEPKIITLSELGFAFVILGVGLGCAIVLFIVEIIIHRFQRRVTTTRVTVLNRLE